MKLFTLIEDSKGSHAGLIVEHGLSLYFKHGGKRILFDTGTTDAFIYNATIMGIDLSKVDACVISHVHNDHTGGLKYFLELNKTSKVYLKRDASCEYYIKRYGNMKHACIQQKLFEEYADRLEFIEEDTEIAQGVFAASIDIYRHVPRFASLMYKKQDEAFIPDDLKHELFVAIKGEKGTAVLTACSHHGIINILMTAREKFGKVESVVGGFHLDGARRCGMRVKGESGHEINAIAKYINENKIKKVYTGHCTGEKAFEKLEMLAQVKKMHTGDIIEI